MIKCSAELKKKKRLKKTSPWLPPVLLQRGKSTYSFLLLHLLEGVCEAQRLGGVGGGQCLKKSEPSPHTRTRETHTCTVIAGAIQQHSAALCSSRWRINGGCGIRVNLLGPHGPGFVSKPHFGFVEGNGNDTRAKQGKQSLWRPSF